MLLLIVLLVFVSLLPSRILERLLFLLLAQLSLVLLFPPQLLISCCRLRLCIVRCPLRVASCVLSCVGGGCWLLLAWCGFVIVG